MAKDYYSILDVSKNASADEIKKAYRKQALKYHPDKGGDQEKFKEVNEAYQVLGNPQKRAQFDQFGTAGDNFSDGSGSYGYGFSNQAGGFNFEDIFSSAAGGGGFGFGGIFEDLFGSTFAQVNVEAHISLTQAILGADVHLRTQEGEEIELKIPPGTQDGQTFKFRDKGMSYKRGRGNLNITVRIKLPRRINRRQKELFEELRREGL